MYSDKLLLLKLDDIQEGLYRLDYNLNASDSLAISKLSDMSTSLSDIQNCIVAHSQNTFLGVSWDILLPALISLGIFILITFSDECKIFIIFSLKNFGEPISLFIFDQI